MKLSTHRMEALVDGIFAIVMTIMIVSLSEVLNFTNPVHDADFHKLFLNLGEDFLIYAASFLILGVLWLEHHWQFHFIKHIDPALVLLNIVWFIFLCIIPFSAMLLGNHSGFFLPLLVFEANIFIVFFILHMHWIYATHKGRLVDISLDPKALSKHKNAGSLLVMATFFAIVLTVIVHLIWH